MKHLKRVLVLLLAVAMVFTFVPETAFVKAASSTTSDETYGFHVSGSKLLDANGNQFIMRGINHAHTWFKDQSTTTLKALAADGCNTVRIVLSNGKRWSKDDLSTVKSLIAQCKELKMIAVLEVHDATGSNNVSDLLAAADYFVEMKNALIGNEAYVIVNIANEWYGDWAVETWKSGNIQAIKELRNAGIKNTIMIDAAGWGQYPASIAQGGKEVFAADELGNTMFSTHMYEYAGGSETMVKNNIDSVAKTGLCQVIGEFGWKHTDGDVAEETIMSYCQEKGIGYMAWSWKGNGGGVEFLDLSNDWAGNSLSDWGDEVVNGTYGLKATAKTCSVFDSSATVKPVETTQNATVTPEITQPAVTSEAPATTEAAVTTQIPTGTISLFSGSKEAGNWSQAVTLDTVKNSGTFDPSMISKDGYFTVTYTGEKGAVQLVFQSWSGGAGWAQVNPNETSENADGTYTSKFTYSDITAAYGTDFSGLDRVYVSAGNGSITVKSMDYVTGRDAGESVMPTQSTEPEESIAPSQSAAPEESVVPTETTVPDDKNGSVYFEGSKEVGSWSNALELTTVKDNGDFDPSDITKDGYFAVTYTGTRNCIQMIFQSWSGGGNWCVAAPSKIRTNNDGSYTAVFDYDTISGVYGTSYSLLDKVYIQVKEGSIVLKSVSYCSKNKTESSETPAPSETVSQTPSTEPTQTTVPDDESAERTCVADDSHVKVIGRTYFDEDGERWISQSASGIEFKFTGTKAAVTLLGDAAAETGSDSNRARYAVYVNGELVEDSMLDASEKTVDVFNSTSSKEVTVRIVKLSECASSSFGIKNITVTAASDIQPTAAKAHKIEFIGDSITCGYGIDDENINGGFKNSTENALKTYAYKTAEALDADYSMFSISGWGVISGYTGNGTANTDSLIPPVYDKVAFSWGNLGDGVSPQTVPWDFEKNQPDAVVINLGTNDNSYVSGDNAKKTEFIKGYVDFLKQIREKNPNATIFCTLGIMGADLYPQIQEAAAQYTEKTGDSNIYCMQFDVQQMSDGICVDWHPSEATNVKAATKLTSYMKKVMGW